MTSCVTASRASLGSPSFSIYFLKTNELEKYLVVAPCTEMWLRMHEVPPISPSAKKQRNAFTDSRLLRNTNPSVESRRGVLSVGSNVACCGGTVTVVSCGQELVAARSNP